MRVSDAKVLPAMERIINGAGFLLSLPDGEYWKKISLVMLPRLATSNYV